MDEILTEGCRRIGKENNDDEEKTKNSQKCDLFLFLSNTPSCSFFFCFS